MIRSGASLPRCRAPAELRQTGLQLSLRRGGEAECPAADQPCLSIDRYPALNTDDPCLWIVRMSCHAARHRIVLHARRHPGGKEKKSPAYPFMEDLPETPGHTLPHDGRRLYDNVFPGYHHAAILRDRRRAQSRRPSDLASERQKDR